MSTCIGNLITNQKSVSKIKETIYLLNPINSVEQYNTNNKQQDIIKVYIFVKAIIHPLNILDFRTIEYVMKT